MKPLCIRSIYIFFLIVFLGGTINAACDRNLCKLFTKKNGSDVPMKFQPFFLYVTDFCNMGCLKICHDLLCLNVFECLLFIQKICM